METTHVDGPDLTAARQTLRRTSQGKIIGRHPSVREAIETIERVAATTCNVLITGESGTGKELFVAALHDASLRAQGPLVPVNCGAIPKDLLESALFGHTRGAFSGAVNSRSGYVGAAEGGTLFLDEIGEMPTPMQVALLRLIQKHEYVPVGEAKALKCDIRVVAATHRDLEAEVAAGRFRADLFYRLNGFVLTIPPLRERVAEVVPLALRFARKARAQLGLSGDATLKTSATAWLEAYPWPGNIRELRNAMERAVLLAEDEPISLEHLTAQRSKPAPPVAAAKPSAGPDDERARIVAALEQCVGNQTRAAKLLGISRRTLVSKLGLYDVPRPRKAP